MLRVEQVSHYFGGLRAVHELSLAVEQGERRAIIGPNGAGKTTFFNLLSGELLPTRGKIFFEGQEIARLPPFKRARLGIGRTFQRNNLFSGLTVYENIRLAVQQRLGVARHLFRPASSHELLRRESEGLVAAIGMEGRMGERVKYLSYGEQRQLELALALAMQPRLLLLDEPTAGMSPAETAVMVRIIRELPREITLLIIEHDMDVVSDLAEQVTVLHQGEILATGPLQAIKEDARVMEVYLRLDEGSVVDAAGA